MAHQFPTNCSLAEPGHHANFTGIKRALGTEARHMTILEVTPTTLIAKPDDGGENVELTLHGPGLAMAQRELLEREGELIVYGHSVIKIGEFWASHAEPGELTPCEPMIDYPSFAGVPFI